MKVVDGAGDFIASHHNVYISPCCHGRANPLKIDPCTQIFFRVKMYYIFLRLTKKVKKVEKMNMRYTM